MLLLLAACDDHMVMLTEELPRGTTDSAEVLPGRDSATELPGDTTPDSGTDDTAGGDDGNDADIGATVFTADVVHQVQLTVDDAGLTALGHDPYSYVLADVDYDDQHFSGVGVRIKGRLGSLRYLPGKSAFKVDFLQFGGTDKLDGLEKLNLNNMVQDSAKVHELAAYQAYELVGIPAPRVAYAQVWLNGEDYGLYTVVEDYDDRYLARRMDDASGNLYDGDYFLWSNGSYTLVDFSTSSEGYFVLDEGTDVGAADIHALTVAADTPGSFDESFGELLDVTTFEQFVAVTAWIGHSDSYAYYSNNYRVYFDPARGGKAILLPWDPDWAFSSGTAVTSPYGVLASRCFTDGACRGGLIDAVDAFDTTFHASDIPEQVDAAIDLIEPYLADDPKKESDMGTIHSYQADLVSWFDRREGELDAAGL